MYYIVSYVSGAYKWIVLYCETFSILSSCEDEDIGRFLYVH